MERIMARWNVGGVAFLLLMALPALGSAQAAATTQSPMRLGWINLQLILQQTPGYSQAESTFAKEMQSFQAEVQKLQGQFDSTLSAYEQQSIVLSPSAKQSKEAEIRQLQQRMETRRQELSQRAQQRERELVGPIEERVKGVIDGIRAERNIAVIFDASAQGSNIIAADRTLDLTPVIVQRLRGEPQ